MATVKKSAAPARKSAAPRTAYHHGDLPEALCNAVLELLAEKGADKLSMSDAARRAGVSAAAPYRHYKSLEDLLVAAALRVYTRFRALQRQSIIGLEDPQAQMLTFATYFFVFADEDPCGFKLLFNSSMTLTHRELDALSREAFDDAMAIAARLAPKAPSKLLRQFVINVFALVYGNSKLMVERYSPVAVESEFPEIAAAGVRMLIGWMCAQ